MRSSPNSRRAQRGLTLIELLVSITAGLMVVTVAVTAGSGLMQALYGQTKKSGVETQLAIAHVILERGVYNAGAAFPEARYAIHVRNNVTSGSTFTDPSGGGTTSVLSTGQIGLLTATGIIPGTDVIEVAYGDTTVRARGGTASVSGGTTVTFGGGVGSGWDPLLTTDTSTSTVGKVVLFTNYNALLTAGSYTQDRCLAQITSGGTSASPTVVVQCLDEAFAPATCTCSGGVVQSGYYAYMLNTRARYSICQMAGPTQPTTGLCIQTNGGNETGALGALQMVVPGLEDMQVTERVLKTLAGSTCTNPVGNDPYCWCNQTSAMCPNGPSVDTATFQDTTPGSLTYLMYPKDGVRGFNVTLSATGVQQVPFPGGKRPAIYDHAVGPVDNVYHATQEQSFFTINVALGNM